jgi:hypothetical protein
VSGGVLDKHKPIAPLLGSLIINIAAGYGQTPLGYRLVFTAATLFLRSSL